MSTDLNPRAGSAARTMPGPDDTAPTMTLAELTELLDKAAAAAVEVERSRRPVVLNGPVTAAHPGVDFTAPAPATTPTTLAPAGPGHRCGRFSEAQALLLCGMAASTVGLIDAALTGSPVVLLGALAAAAVTALSALAVAVEIRTHRHA